MAHVGRGYNRDVLLQTLDGCQHANIHEPSDPYLGHNFMKLVILLFIVTTSPGQIKMDQRRDVISSTVKATLQALCK